MLGTKNKEITCCFIGHDIIRKKDCSRVYDVTMDLIIKLYNEGYRRFLTSCDLGYSTIASTAVFDAKERFQDIKSVFVLATNIQIKKWSPQDIEAYEKLKLRADNTFSSPYKYLRGFIQKRNRLLVNYSSVCIAYEYKKYDLITNAMKYARFNGLKIYNVCDELNQK